VLFSALGVRAEQSTEKNREDKKMTKHWNTLDEAILEYTKQTGETPTFDKIVSLYRHYRAEWKQFKGFANWLTNHYELV